jgi:hypothetical protein
LMKLPAQSHNPALNIFFLTISTTVGSARASRVRQRNSFSPLEIPTRCLAPPVACFQAIGFGKPGATIIGRRSGAQRGALEDKLRPEVFLDAPLHFSFF